MNKCNFEKLECIPPEQIQKYLEEYGWCQRKVVEQVSVWTYKRQDKMFGLFLPLTRDFVDYRNRIFEILEILQEVEQRSQEDILNTIESKKL